MSNSQKLKDILAKNLSHYIDRSGHTQTDIARKLNIPEMTMSNWLNAKTYPRVDKIQLLADFFNIRRSDLTEDKTEYKTNNVVYKVKENQYPLLPVSISAGIPIIADPVAEYEVNEISVPDAIMGKWAGNKDIRMLRVNGDSMNKVIPHGSLIAVKEVELSSLKNNDIVVYSNDHEYSVKRFINNTDSGMIVFRPESTDNRFTDHIVSYENANNLKIHGKVVLYIVELD